VWGKEGKKRKEKMNEVLSSQVHEHIFGLNGPRRLLAENLDYQQLELTTEDREDHTFNGARFQVYGFFFFLFFPLTTNWIDSNPRVTNFLSLCSF
jgi:hypothetical protein